MRVPRVKIPPQSGPMATPQDEFTLRATKRLEKAECPMTYAGQYALPELKFHFRGVSQSMCVDYQTDSYEKPTYIFE